MSGFVLLKNEAKFSDIAGASSGLVPPQPRHLLVAHNSFCVVDVNNGQNGAATSVSIICPLISTVAQKKADHFEAAVIDPDDLGDAVNLAWTGLMSNWREDRNVRPGVSNLVHLAAQGHIPAILDGEKVILPRSADVRFVADGFTAVVPG